MNWVHPEDNGMPAEALHQVFDGCCGVVVDRERELIHVWNGSQTVNVYTYHGRCVDVWMQDDMDGQDFRAAAISHYDQEQYDA